MRKLFQIAFVIAFAYITAFYTNDTKDKKDIFDFNFDFNFDISDWFTDDYGYHYDPNASIDTLIKEGTYYFDNKDYYVAIEYFKQATELDSLNPEINLYLAKSYENVIDYTLAQVYYQKLLSSDSTYFSTAYMGLGNLSSLLNKYDSAQIYFSKVIALDQNKSEAYLKRGENYLVQTDTLSALKDFEKVASLNPNEYAINLRVATTFFDIKNYKKAIEYYTKCIDFLDADKYTCLKYRAFCFYYLENYSEAILDYKAALELDSSDSYLYYNIAISYDNLEDKKLAIEYFDKFLSVSKESDSYSEYAQERLVKLKEN